MKKKLKKKLKVEGRGGEGRGGEWSQRSYDRWPLEEGGGGGERACGGVCVGARRGARRARPSKKPVGWPRALKKIEIRPGPAR